ncbi:hypothetical protein HKD37_18G050988 [Glycine soja]
MHLEFYPLQAIGDGPQRRYLLLRRRWCICSWLLVLLWLLRCLALCLPGDAVFLDEGPVNIWSDDLAGGDSHSVELTEARNQSGKPQGPVGLLRVHRMSGRCNPCKLINSVRYELSHMHTHLYQDGINQLTVRQGEVRVVVTG